MTTPQDRLVGLWKRLTATPEPPALDRWLGRELSRLDGMPRDDRLMLGDMLTDALRFAPLTVFCEAWRGAGLPAETVPADLLAEHASFVGPQVWRRLRRAPVPAVFFWTFMRKRLAGFELPAIAPPGPAAQAIWRTVRLWAAEADDPTARALWAGLPPVMTGAVAARAAAVGWSADATMSFLDRHAVRPPLWLRPLADEAVLADELRATGFAVESVDGALAATGSRGVFELSAYREGRVEIQDLASQGIGRAVGAEPGHMVWDCCAGAGGKALQLAAVLRGKGAVHATDVVARKLDDLRRRARRAGVDNIRAAAWDGEAVPDFGPEVATRGGFDRVLVDAPCSGSGTWRRHPDGRLRFLPEQLEALVAVQAHLLDVVAPAVRPGGRLVYATCSWFVEENEAVVAGFLERAQDWRLVSQSLMGNPAADADTTFAAVLERAP